MQHPFRRGGRRKGREEQSGGQIGRHFLIRLPLELVRPAGERWSVSSGLGELEPLGLRTMALDLLRASLPVGGRALTLYEEVHPQKKLANRDVQHRFLQRLAQRLPAEASWPIPASRCHSIARSSDWAGARAAPWKSSPSQSMRSAFCRTASLIVSLRSLP